MKRSEAINLHTEEAAAARGIAAQAPNSPGASQLLAQARDHDAMAQAARVGDYPTDLED